MKWALAQYRRLNFLILPMFHQAHFVDCAVSSPAKKDLLFNLSKKPASFITFTWIDKSLFLKSGLLSQQRSYTFFLPDIFLRVECCQHALH